MIRELKTDMDRMKRKFASDKTAKVTQTLEKSDLEQLFVRCVEDMRKEIIKRRLKSEVHARKKIGGLALSTINQSVNSMRKSTSAVSDHSINEGNPEFEETLGKLAELAKGRVKYDEFT